jgi:hypothetical protein
MAESMGHDLTRNDPADQPRCPMEALADRMHYGVCPKWMAAWARRIGAGEVYFTLEGVVSTPDQLDDLIAFLQEVRG